MTDSRLLKLYDNKLGNLLIVNSEILSLSKATNQRWKCGEKTYHTTSLQTHYSKFKKLMRNMILYEPVFVHKCCFVVFMIALVVPVTSRSAPSVPIWWGNDIGKEAIVLPGFDPILVEGHNIKLGMGREYRWKNSYLPVEMKSRNEVFVTKSDLIITIDGITKALTPDHLSIIKESGHDVVMKADGIIGDSLKISVITHVEYDGMAMVEMVLTPIKPVLVTQLHLVANVLENSWTKMLAFNANTIDDRENNMVREPRYQGAFLNALSIIDGEKSFWLFQDNAEGWVGNTNDMLTISANTNLVDIRQKFINHETLISNEKIFKFNFMVTPIKSAPGNIRRNRIARGSTLEEGKYHGIGSWWITAFAHQVLPYVKYPPGVESVIPNQDKKVYPGLESNKKILADYRQSGIDRLPYFSAHVLNYLDPAYKQYKKMWEAHPVVVWNRMKYDDPFIAKRNDTFLTHRAYGYSDYLLYRFSELIDQLGMEGLYFDQGGIRSSSNPLNGRWTDIDGRVKGSTDILALRQFHKRLATLFYLKGKKGIIVSHNSNSMVFPAYSFVTSMVQGEEFNERLIKYDYIGSAQLAEVRSRLGGTALGVPTVWLEVIFAEDKRLNHSKRPYSMTKNEWLASTIYQNAYLNYMALALLHDMPTWSFADMKLRNTIMKAIDWVNPETAEFVGYWNYPANFFESKLFYSFYRSMDNKKYLFVVANLNDMDQKFELKKLESIIVQKSDINKCSWLIDNGWNGDRSLSQLNIKAKGFELLSLVCK